MDNEGRQVVICFKIVVFCTFFLSYAYFNSVSNGIPLEKCVLNQNKKSPDVDVKAKEIHNLKMNDILRNFGEKSLVDVNTF